MRSRTRFTIDKEQTLFSLPGYTLVDVAPDGRFLMSTIQPGQSTGIRVVVNWASELRK